MTTPQKPKKLCITGTRPPGVYPAAHICHTKGVTYCMHRTNGGACTRKTKLHLCDWGEGK